MSSLQVDRLWQAFLRRFDLEHTFRLFKAGPRLDCPQDPRPARRAADRRTWLIIAIHTQLRLAQPLADDLCLLWERPAPPGRLTPASVRRGFRNIRATIPRPAGVPKPGKPGPRPAARIKEPPHPTTTWGKPPEGNALSGAGANVQVKRQA